MKNIFVVFAAICLWTTTKADYRAAVVEYAPTSGTSPNLTLEANLNEYRYYLERAKQNQIDIVVFPEYGLTGLTDDPVDFAIEIPDNSTSSTFNDYVLQSLSDAAKEHSLYIVVNLLEKARNENNETIYYNTNIVFDRNGLIVAKYRKINLFLEPNLTPGNETVSFTTDFQITFGLFTCFDILFYKPSRQILADNPLVTDIIFPTAWTSTLPFYHSLSVQSGYAQANNVNLLAANLNSPSKGIGGSGIYGNNGTLLTYYISGSTSAILLMTTLTPGPVPRAEDTTNTIEGRGFNFANNDTAQFALSNFISLRDFQSSRYQFKELSLAQGAIQETLCDNTFCCNFNISVVESSVNSNEVYQLLVYDGPTDLGGTQSNIKICTLISCESSDTGTCGTRNVSTSTKFNISITGDFENLLDYFYQPVTLNTDLLPISNLTFTQSKYNETNSVSLQTTQAVEKLIVFGVFGRGGASNIGSSLMFIVAISLFKYLF